VGLVPRGRGVATSHRLVVISGHHGALDYSLVRIDRDVLYDDQAADEIGTSYQSQNGQSDRRRRAASFFAGRQVDRIISRMSPMPIASFAAPRVHVRHWMNGRNADIAFRKRLTY
jgi:hypothetical protein